MRLLQQHGISYYIILWEPYVRCSTDSRHQEHSRTHFLLYCVPIRSSSNCLSLACVRLCIFSPKWAKLEVKADLHCCIKCPQIYRKKICYNSILLLQVEFMTKCFLKYLIPEIEAIYYWKYSFLYRS